MVARKRQLLIWITAALLFCLITYPIHQARASDEDRKGYRELLEYIGDVGVNSVIRVTIEKQGQHLSGTYFYKKSLKDITLEGEYITDRDIVLHELDSHGIAGATFSLSFAEKDPRGTSPETSRSKKKCSPARGLMPITPHRILCICI
jgi:hypothetical protein